MPVPRVTLDETLDRKDEFSKTVPVQLAKSMVAHGFQIHKFLRHRVEAWCARAGVDERGQQGKETLLLRQIIKVVETAEAGADAGFLPEQGTACQR